MFRKRNGWVICILSCCCALSLIVFDSVFEKVIYRALFATCIEDCACCDVDSVIFALYVMMKSPPSSGVLSLIVNVSVLFCMVCSVRMSCPVVDVN